jgi:hypothetical protein
MFPGWTRDDECRHYYFRQLRDMKMKIDLDTMIKGDWPEYVDICGWTWPELTHGLATPR